MIRPERIIKHNQRAGPHAGRNGGDGGAKPQRESKEARRARKLARATEEAEGEAAQQQPCTGGASLTSEAVEEMPRLNAECDTGPIEHKWRLKRPPPIRFQQLVSDTPLPPTWHITILIQSGYKVLATFPCDIGTKG